MNKIAISGKGGVGKTTLCALVVHALAESGQKVYAIDADPNPTLAEALGFPPEVVSEITPIIEMEKLIEERTGSRAGEYGSYFKLNPRVKDIPDEYSVQKDNISYLMMGMMRGAGKGCACAQNSMLKALVTHLLVKEKETVVLDMVAGTEHMGRGTAESVDAMIIVVEPALRSIKAAKEFSRMAADLGIKNIYVAGNKVTGPEDEEYIRSKMPGFSVAGFLPYTAQVIQAERDGSVLYEQSVEMKNAVHGILQNISILA